MKPFEVNQFFKLDQISHQLKPPSLSRPMEVHLSFKNIWEFGWYMNDFLRGGVSPGRSLSRTSVGCRTHTSVLHSSDEYYFSMFKFSKSPMDKQQQTLSHVRIPVFRIIKTTVMFDSTLSKFSLGNTEHSWISCLWFCFHFWLFLPYYMPEHKHHILIPTSIMESWRGSFICCCGQRSFWTWLASSIRDSSFHVEKVVMRCSIQQMKQWLLEYSCMVLTPPCG